MESETKKPKIEAKNSNKELSNLLIELAEYEKNFNKQIHKYNAYRKAAQSISEHSNKITSISEAKKLKGIGKKISEKIEQYLTNGKIDKIEKIRNNSEANSIKELTRVTGIGPSHAHQMLKEGIKTLDDLRANQNKLSHHQKIGLKYVEDFEKRIPRDEMVKMRDFIVKEIELIDKQYLATICGSFRRGAESSGDIDILLTHPNYVSSAHLRENKEIKHKKDLIVVTNKSPQGLLKKVVNKLIELKFITDTLAIGETKFMGVCNLNKTGPYRRIDIRLIPKDQYYCGILYFTGSDTFNKNMRKIAIDKGYTLNEYSLRKIGSTGVPGKAALINSEEEIFEYLDMEYKKPEERN